MANIPIYDGNPIWNANAVPFGFYNSDVDFQVDAVRVAKFCASRLGYPLVDVELQSGSFFTAFEEAVTTYGNELYAFQIRDNQLSLIGAPTSSNLNTTVVTPSFEPIVRLTEQYGVEAGTGGNIPYYTGSIPLTSSVQDYDVAQWAIDEGITSSIEIKRVFYQEAPAIVRYYDPYAGTGFGYQSLFDSFGFGSFSPAINFLMMPLSYDLQTIQAIELNDQIRRSNFSFELKNNKIKIFPIPISDRGNLRFEYILREDRINQGLSNQPGNTTNVSNTPYSNPTYSSINSVGRQWIFEYTIAIVKEILGLVRNKYSNIPIPNAEISLNGDVLVSQAAAEKTALIERLRGYFDDTSCKALLERRAQETEFKQSELRQVPFPIYIG